MGCELGGLPVSIDTFERAAVEQGWEFTALGVVPDMESKGLTASEIISELITVEIAAFRLAAKERS